jgi:hypothetical protein
VASPATLLLILSSFAITHIADGCLALSDKGVVGVNNEVAVIIWDKSHQTEHFIRSVSLDPKFDDAGFLVPTPTTPELAVADERIFDLAESRLLELSRRHCQLQLPTDCSPALLPSRTSVITMP